MRIGFYGESPADHAAMRVFVGALLGSPPEEINLGELEARTQPAFFSALPGVFRGVYFNSDADGLVIVGDCDDDPMHEVVHETPGSAEDRCRLCRARKVVDEAKRGLKPRQGRGVLKLAFGLPVPAIEAWYLVGKEPGVGEAAWKVGLQNGKPPFARDQLKRMVYGTGRPSLEHETAVAVSEAQRIVGIGIDRLVDAFPAGFGLMAREIRSWVT